jgi:glutathione reductase (NADPH)
MEARLPFDYDLFVIGGGSGGVRAARMAAGTGARVAMAEEYRVGGTCVIRGCVPKKLFVYASHFPEEFADAKGFGWSVERASFDWPTLRDNVQREIARLSAIYTANVARTGAEIFESRAVLEDPHTIRLEATGRSVTAKTVLVATGAWPFIPDIHGREHIISSNEAFTLPRLPRSIAIIGGGYIGVEFASIFHGLGVDVTLIYRGDQILRGFDDDLRVGLSKAMQAKGIHLIFNQRLGRIEKDGDECLVIFEDGTEIRTDLVMYATGRVPLTAGMGLMESGVNLGLDGEILVDEYSRSSVENIYAIGDVTHRLNLTPVAIHDAMCFVDTAFRGKPTPVDHTFVPTAVFSQPEIGTVGLTEAIARERFPEIDIYKASFRPLKYVLAERNERMLMKLVVDARTDMVLGCHILGPDAAEMAQILAIPLRMGVKKADFDATMSLHPSVAEELVTMREKWQPPSPQA